MALMKAFIRAFIALVAAACLLLLVVGLQLQDTASLRQASLFSISSLMHGKRAYNSSGSSSSSTSSSPDEQPPEAQAEVQQHEPPAALQTQPQHKQHNQSEHVDVLVTIMNRHWWSEFLGNDFVEPHCGDHRGKPLRCRFVSLFNNSNLSNGTADELLSQSDGLLYHITSPDRRPDKARRETPLVLMSLESAAYYPVIDNSTRMQPVDIEYSYRTCAQVYQPYYTLAGQLQLAQLQTPPEPFANKVDAVLYVNSNCMTQNQRHLFIRDLKSLMAARKSKIQLHSYGRCDRNVGEEEVQHFAKLGGQAKIEFGRQYKFCVAMENSNAFDYVTEKVYNALQAGCLPIYYGAPNIADYVPDMRGLITVQGLGLEAKLLDELERLAANQTAYEEKLAWKSKGIKELSPGFQRLHALPPFPNGKCRLCKLLAEHRDAPKNYTPCHANSTWQEARRRASQPGHRRLH